MQASLDPRRPNPLHVLLVGAALLVLLGSVPLFDQDEGAYAGFARTMWLTGDLRMPAFPLSEMHRKPPLTFWLIAGSYRLLGESWWSLRLPVALCMAGVMVLLATWGAPLFGRAHARTAAVLLGTSTAVLFGRIALTDGVLLLCSTTAVLGGLRWLAGGGPRWLAAAWAGVALGMLTKGPAIGPLLVGMLPVLLAHPGRRRLAPLALVLLAAPLPLLGWGAWAWSVDEGATVRWMVDWYLLQRAGGSILGQSGPPGTYAVLMLVLFLPWAGLVPAGLAGLAGGLRQRDPAAVGLGAWLVGGWLVWELLPSKLPAYALGGWPALALVAAGALHQPEQWPRLLRAGLAIQGLVLLALGAGLVYFGLGPLQGGAGAALLGVGLLGLVGAAAVRRSPGLWTLVAPVLVVGAWAVVLPRLEDRLHPTWTVARVARAVLPPGAPVVVEPAWRLPSLFVYFLAEGHPLRLAAEGEAQAPGELWIRSGPEAPAGACTTVVEGWVPDKGVPTAWHLAYLPEEGANSAACTPWPGTRKGEGSGVAGGEE